MRERFDLTSPDAYLWEVYWLAVVVTVALLVVNFVWRLRHRRAQRAYFRAIGDDPTTTLAPSTLAPGLCSLAGVVEAETPGEPPITVSATFTADEYERSVQRAEAWSPEVCVVEARRFTLLLNGTGERLQVLPSSEVQLAACAAIGRVDNAGAGSDVLFTAVLRDGERALVTGELSQAAFGDQEAGYRERRASFKLESPAGGRLRVQAASATAERRAAPMPAQKGLGYGSILFAVLVGGLSITSIVEWRIRGETVVADVVEVDPERRLLFATYFSTRGGAGLKRVYCSGISYDVTNNPVEVGDRVLIMAPPIEPSKCFIGVRTLFGDPMALYWVIAAACALAFPTWRLVAGYPPPFVRRRWFDVATRPASPTGPPA